MQGGRAVKDYSEVFVGLDVSKRRNAVALAERGDRGEVRYFGEIDNTPAATRQLVMKLAKRYRRLQFCYEAGPTGYGLYRQLRTLGQDCIVVAPSLIPRKAGDRTKTNKRDATSLARLHRAGELTAVWVPDEAHEALRDLVRVRGAACRDLRSKRQQISSFLLRHGRSYERKTWGRTHAVWLARQSFDHEAQTTAFHDMVEAARSARERLSSLEAEIARFAEGWSLAPVARALQAMRGIDFLSAVTFLAEVGDLTRFESPRQLMAYLGLVPSESSSGDSIHRGPITKMGNSTARRTLVECAWSYRFTPRVGERQLARVSKAPKIAQEIAWKAQRRLTRRYRHLIAKGRAAPLAATAIAREMAGFIWAIAREITKHPSQQKGDHHLSA
jgi:transposase